MKGYILDSDTWIEYFHHRSGVGAHIAQVPKDEIFTSEVSIAEPRELQHTRKWRNNDQEDTIRQAIARQVPFGIEGLFFYYPFRNFLEWVVIFSRVGWGRLLHSNQKKVLTASGSFCGVFWRVFRKSNMLIFIRL